MMDEIDFEAWAQQYEDENAKLRKHIRKLQRQIKVCGDSECREIKVRICLLKSILWDNQKTAEFLRERDRRQPEERVGKENGKIKNEILLR